MVVSVCVPGGSWWLTRCSRHIYWTIVCLWGWVFWNWDLAILKPWQKVKAWLCIEVCIVIQAKDVGILICGMFPNYTNLLVRSWISGCFEMAKSYETFYFVFSLIQILFSCVVAMFWINVWGNGCECAPSVR